MICVYIRKCRSKLGLKIAKSSGPLNNRSGVSCSIYSLQGNVMAAEVTERVGEGIGKCQDIL